MFALPIVICTSVSLANGVVSYKQSPVSNGVYPFHTQASFTCHSGYRLDGSGSSICHGRGTWSHISKCTQGIERNDLKKPL